MSLADVEKLEIKKTIDCEVATTIIILPYINIPNIRSIYSAKKKYIHNKTIGKKRITIIHYFELIDLVKFKLLIVFSSFRKTKDDDSSLRHHLMKISFYAEKKTFCERRKKVKSPTKTHTHTDCLMRRRRKCC